MKGIILAAGNGTRLGDLTRDCPKPLLMIYDRPMICLPLQRMVRAGIDTIGIVIQPRFREQFETFLQEPHHTYGAYIELIEQPESLGMAHAIRMAGEFVQNQVCMVLSGDTMNSFDFQEAVRDFQTGATIFVCQESDIALQRASGVVEINDQGAVLRITEKPSEPASDLIQIGGGIYDETLFDRIETLEPSSRGEYEITSVHESYLRDGNIHCVRMGEDTYYNNITYPEDVKNASAWLEDNHHLFI